MSGASEEWVSLSTVVRYGCDLAAGQDSGKVAAVHGLVVFAKLQAAQLAFWVLNDGTAEVQLILTPAALGQAQWATVYETTSSIRGRAVTAVGTVLRTSRGMLSVRAHQIGLIEGKRA